MERSRIGTMKTIRTACLVCVLAVTATASTKAETQSSEEKTLASLLAGKVLRVQPAAAGERFKLELPREDSRALEGQERFHIEINKLKLKERELELEVRRVYWHQDATGQIHGFRGHAREYRLRWQGAVPSEEEFTAALAQFFPMLGQRPEEWTNYWPPSVAWPKDGKELAEQPSREVAPGVYTPGIGLTPAQPVAGARVRGGVVTTIRETDLASDRGDQPERIVRRAIVTVLITETGRVAGTRIERSYGPAADQVAVMTVSDIRFKPAQRQGVPVRQVARIEVEVEVVR